MRTYYRNSAFSEAFKLMSSFSLPKLNLDYSPIFLQSIFPIYFVPSIFTILFIYSIFLCTMRKRLSQKACFNRINISLLLSQLAKNRNQSVFSTSKCNYKDITLFMNKDFTNLIHCLNRLDLILKIGLKFCKLSNNYVLLEQACLTQPFKLYMHRAL